jgi:uncharacterized membrane protein
VFKAVYISKAAVTAAPVHARDEQALANARVVGSQDILKHNAVIIAIVIIIFITCTRTTGMTNTIEPPPVIILNACNLMCW